MREEQKLYPQLIYRINNALSELKTEFKKHSDFNDNLFIAPSVLNPYSRTFNWLLVAEGRWKLIKKLMSEIQSKIKNSKNEWNQFKEEFKKTEEVKSVADAIHSIENSENLKPEEYHSALLFLYQSYPINNKEYFDGIIYQNLIKRAKTSDGKNHRIDYAEAELLIKKRKNNELYPPVDIVFYYGKRKEPKKALSQVINNTKDSNNNFHKNYLLPFFGKYENTFDPKNFLVLKPKHFSKFQFLYIIPFYDALYGQYGNICGILTIFFSETEKRKSFIKSKAKEKLIARLPSYVEEIKRAALFEILQQPIEDSTDFLKNYIKCLPMLQDWERVMVWEIKKEKRISEAELIYCYKRYKHDRWDECAPVYSKCKKCKAHFDKLKDKIIKTEKKHLTTKETDIQLKNSKHIVLLEKILTRKLIPELYEEDEIKYKNIRLIYEYPSYTIFPDDEAKKYSLGLFYERQQIDLLRQMALKRREIRETIKHGTRAAVAAIMGRNMSHNIGSHVLSYLSEKDGYGFLRYLQGRADFLAEISTTKPKWTAQRKLISDIISPFVYSDIKFKRGELLDNIGRSVYIDKNYLDASRIKIIVLLNKFKIKYDYNCKEGKFEDPIINDCEGKNASAAFEDLPVEIPHGIMGSHALYSILENFIRNSVKHNAEEIKNKLRDNNFKLEIYIKVIDVYKNEGAKQNKQFEGLIKIRLYDNISKYTNEAKEDIEKHIDVKMNGKLVKNDGSLEGGGGWGLKEMRLSAAWLRSVPPENIQFKDEDPPVIRLDMENSYICYEFFLLKPLDVLIINNYKTSKEDQQKGIYIANSLEKVEYLLDSGKLRHRFVVFNVSDIENGLNDNQLLRLPARIFVVTDEKVSFCEKKIVYISLDEYKKIISDKKYIVIRLYKKWIEYLSGSIIPKILVKGDSRVKDTINSLEKHCLPAIDNEKQIIFEHPANNLNIDNQIYWEPFSTGAGKGTLSGKLKILRDSNDEITKLKTLYEIYEAVLINIVIVDERLFTKVDRETTFMNVRANKRELLEKWKIDVINLGKVNGELIVYSKGSSNAWNEYINNKNITFLSIHQTIIKDIGEDLFHSKIVSSKEIRHVIIHSGRGPVDITPGFKFLEFSNIENLIIDTPDKHLLTDLFMGIKGGVE